MMGMSRSPFTSRGSAKTKGCAVANKTQCRYIPAIGRQEYVAIEKIGAVLLVCRISRGDLIICLRNSDGTTKPVPRNIRYVNLAKPKAREIFMVTSQPREINICAHPIGGRSVFLGEGGASGDNAELMPIIVAELNPPEFYRMS